MTVILLTRDLVERCCVVLHDAYEEAAAQNGWSTQTDSRVPWPQVPAANQETMRAAVTELLSWLNSPDAAGARDS